MDPLELLKSRLGFMNPPEAVLNRLNLLIEDSKNILEKEKGIEADLTNSTILMFIVEHAAWMYESKGEKSGMPRHLQFRLHNLYIHNRKENEDV